jgi:hypothetical protein
MTARLTATRAALTATRAALTATMGVTDVLDGDTPIDVGEEDDEANDGEAEVSVSIYPDTNKSLDKLVGNGVKGWSPSRREVACGVKGGKGVCAAGGRAAEAHTPLQGGLRPPTGAF